MKFAPYSDSLLKKWVMFKESEGLLKDLLIDSSIKDPTINAGLGYFYIDHQAGVSLGLEYLLSLGEKNQVQKSYSLMEADNTRTILRYDVCQSFTFHTMNPSGLIEFNLPSQPEWAQYYVDHPDWDWMLKEKRFDDLRAPGFPYDLQFQMFGSTQDTEVVWGRFWQKMPQESVFALELLVEPHQDFGVHQGDYLPVILTKIDDVDLLVWQSHFGSLEKNVS